MYIYITHMYIHIHHKHLHMHICMHTCTYAFMTYIHVCIDTCVYISSAKFAFVYIDLTKWCVPPTATNLCVHMHCCRWGTHTLALARVRLYVQKWTHTHTHTLDLACVSKRKYHHRLGRRKFPDWATPDENRLFWISGGCPCTYRFVCVSEYVRVVCIDVCLEG